MLQNLRPQNQNTFNKINKSKPYVFNEIDCIKNIKCEIRSIWKFQLHVSTKIANFSHHYIFKVLNFYTENFYIFIILYFLGISRYFLSIWQLYSSNNSWWFIKQSVEFRSYNIYTESLLVETLWACFYQVFRVELHPKDQKQSPRDGL